MRPITKAVSGMLLDADDEGADFVVSTAAPDRDGDTVDQDALDWEQFDSNPVATLTHDTDTIPVGRWENRRQASVIDPATGQKVDATVMRFVYNRNTQVGREVADSIQGGFLNAASVSFLPESSGMRNKHGGSDYSDQRLSVTECAVCAVGSNQGATRAAKICKRFLSKARDMDREDFHREAREPKELEPGYDEAIGLAYSADDDEADEGADDAVSATDEEQEVTVSPRIAAALRKFIEGAEVATVSIEERELLEKFLNSVAQASYRSKKALRKLGSKLGMSINQLERLSK